MRKNIYFNTKTAALLEQLSGQLNRSMSEIVEIALLKYQEDNQDRAEKEFQKCYEQLGNSITYLESIRDYQHGNLIPETWGIKDEEILKLLNEAIDPLMYYSNAKVRKEHPDWFDDDGDMINEHRL
jgi:hypothetical protein